ncbi:MAG: hypothetical protein EBU84_09950 [Actinobacteria bacterium]|nr:hypothetical protein [Actinomycetota bacterium]
MRTVVVAVVVAVWVPVGFARATIYTAPTGDAAEWLFDPTSVVSVSLDFPQESLDALALDPYTYVPAAFSMVAGATTYGPWNIQAKIKGRIGSYRALPGKSAFKLKFSNSAQRVSGLKKLTLNNMVQDPSKIHETVVYRLYRSVGVPAPRTGYANLSINGEPFGLYLNVETVDDVMLEKWYGADNTNHLYEGTYLGWSNQWDPFDGGYEVDEGDENNRTDLQNLYSLNNTAAEQWFATMKDIVDFQNVVRMWAVERYSGHWDGYTADIVNNFYFHSDANDKFTMLPWGTDQTWGGDLDYSSVNGGTLFVNCMNVKRCRDMYVRAIEIVRDTAQSLNLATYASDIYAGIRSHLDADPKKEHSIEDADWHASSTQSVISNQIDRVNRWLAVESAAPLLLGLTENSESIQVTWRPSQLTSTEFAVAPYPVTAHRVFYRRAGAPTWKSIDAPGAGSESAEITDLSSGVEYEVRVAAVSTRRVWPSSNTESITLGLPTRVLFAETSAMGKWVRLRWRAPVSFGASTSEDAVYRIEMRPLVGRRWQPGALGKMIPNSAGWYVRWVELTNPERVHEFRIRVETDYGESEWVTLRQAYG